MTMIIINKEDANMFIVQAIADQCMPFTQEEILGTYCSTWKITNFSTLEGRVRGPTFETGDLKW